MGGTGRAGGRRPAGGWIDDEADDAPVRALLSRRRVVAAAIAFVDTAGLDALSIRRLASELGVTPMAIYGHVSSKEELLDLMLDLVLGEVELTGAPRPPLAAARAVIVRVNEVLERHGGVARVYAGSVRIGPNGVRIVDVLLGHLVRAGLEPRAAAATFLALFTFTMGHHQMGRAAGDDESRAALAGPGLSPPAAAAAAQLFAGSSRARRFEDGLDLLFDGIRARLAG